jgi:hypothetical protein
LVRKNCRHHQPEDEDNYHDAESTSIWMLSTVNHLEHCIDESCGNRQHYGDEQGFGSHRRASHGAMRAFRRRRQASAAPHQPWLPAIV